MSTEVLLALIGGVVVIAADRGRCPPRRPSTPGRPTRRGRVAAYAEFVVRMNAFVHPALSEARGIAVNETGKAGWERVVKLNGVASPKGLDAMIAWCSSGINLHSAKVFTQPEMVLVGSVTGNC
jgi:hypothetical protein